MATYNSGSEAKVGDVVVLPDGREGTVTQTSPERGNEASVTVAVTLAARSVTPVA